jgi:hypothetical protein
MGKIEKLTKDIEKLKAEIEKHEDKIHQAKEMEKTGRIDKDQLSRAKHKYQTKIRECRATIHRKEKARLHFEKEEKEKREKDKKDKTKGH